MTMKPSPAATKKAAKLFARRLKAGSKWALSKVQKPAKTEQ